MAGTGEKASPSWSRIVRGALAIAAAALVLIFWRFTVAAAILLLAVALLAMGVMKILTAGRATHAPRYLRAFGVAMGALFIIIGFDAIISRIERTFSTPPKAG